VTYLPAEPVEPLPAAAPANGVVAYRSPLLMGAVAVVLVISGIANIILYNMSPGGPVEAVLAYGSGASWALTGLAVGIVAIVLSRGNREPTVFSTGVDGLSITSVSLGGVALIIWAVFGGGYFLVRVFSGLEYRFMEDVNGAFFAGIPWMLAIVFGVISFRTARSASNILALIGIGIGILLLIPTLASGVIYGLHLSP